MTKSSATKKALGSSIVALLLCFTMLMGATFAWFTDNVSSTGNRIQAGDLEVDLVMDKLDGAGYMSIADSTGDIFSEATGNGINWEPGKTEIVYLGVRNNGSLALKYNILLDIVDGNPGLIGSLEFAILDGVKAGEIAETDWASLKARSDAQTGDVLAGRIVAAQGGILDEIALTGEANETDYFALAVHMKEEAGNEFENGAITIDVRVIATQKDAEDDSFGSTYDEDATLDFFPVSSVAELKAAIANQEESILLTADVESDEPITVDYDVTISGAGKTIERADGYTGVIFNVAAGKNLTLNDVIIDGGAIWNSGSSYSLRSSNVVTNTGATTTDSLIVAGANSNIVLNEGVVLQNNDGAVAVNLGTRIGATLTLNGAEIINNRSGCGAIWGGGNIIINSGKINNNSSTGLAGAIRMVSNCNLTMNGGEINYNTAATSGGAIWGSGVSRYTFNGGEMAYNTAALGGAIYTGEGSPISISGDFEMHDNTADDAGAIRFTNGTSLTMTGGKIYGNTSTNTPDWNGFYGWNVGINISGGEIRDDFTLQCGYIPALGGSGITGTVHFALSTNHNTVSLAKDFGTIKFTVANGTNFANFNFKPAADYTYTDGDETKLVCLNAGYVTYWDAATSTFRLMAE